MTSTTQTVLDLATRAAPGVLVATLSLVGMWLTRYVLWLRGFHGELAPPLSPWKHVEHILPIVRGLRNGDTMSPLLKVAAKGQVTALWVLYQPLIIVTSLPLMRSLVQEGINNYREPYTMERSERQVGQMGAVFGRSILFTSGKEWRWRRETTMPFFQPRALNRIAESTVAMRTSDMLRFFHERVTASKDGTMILDVDNIFIELTCKIITAVLLGADFDWTKTPVGSARKAVDCITEINDVAIARTTAGTLIPALLGSAEKPKALLRSALLPTIQQIRVNQASSSGPTGTDSLLEHLARNPKYSDEDLVIEAVAMLLAGTETTAHTMSFALHELSKQPALLQRLHDEAVEVFGEFDGSHAVDLTTSLLGKLAYAGCVFKETLRKYPSVGMMIVRSRETTRIGEHEVPANTDIIMNVRGILHDPVQFPQPDVFRPDRWTVNNEDVLDGAKQAIPEVWFNLGAHQCAGRSLAITEAKSVLSLIAREFLVLPSDPTYTPVITNLGLLKPKEGVKVMLKLRT